MVLLCDLLAPGEDVIFGPSFTPRLVVWWWTGAGSTEGRKTWRSNVALPCGPLAPGEGLVLDPPQCLFRCSGAVTGSDTGTGSDAGERTRVGFADGRKDNLRIEQTPGNTRLRGQ